MNAQTRRLMLPLVGALTLCVPRPAAAQIPVIDHGVAGFSPVAPCNGLNPFYFAACPAGFVILKVLDARFFATTQPAVVEVTVQCISIDPAKAPVGTVETHIDRWTYSVTGPLLVALTSNRTAVDLGQSATITLQLTCSAASYPNPPFSAFPGLRIPITNSRPSALAAPANVTVGQGMSSVAFAVTGKLVDAPTPVTLSITLFGQTISVTVTVQPPTPAALIAMTQANVNALVTQGVLSRGQGNALNVKLLGALEKLQNGQTHVAVNRLRAFVNQVRDLVSSGELTSAQAQPLIEAAESLIRQLGG